MKRSDIPPEAAMDFLGRIAERNRAALERNPFAKVTTTAHLTRDEALNIWAASKWLETFETWNVGIEETPIPLTQAIRFLGELVEQLKKQAGQEEMMIVLKQASFPVMETAVRHLDRYSMQRTIADEKTTRNYGGKRR